MVNRIVITKTPYVKLLELEGEYKKLNNKDLDELLKKYNLYVDKEKIMELQKELPSKIEKVSKKLIKLKEKWKKIFY